MTCCVPSCLPRYGGPELAQAPQLFIKPHVDTVNFGFLLVDETDLHRLALDVFFQLAANIGRCLGGVLFVELHFLVNRHALAGKLGIEISWGRWALAAIVPGIVSLIAIPWVMSKIYPPTVTKTPEAPQLARLLAVLALYLAVHR